MKFISIGDICSRVKAYYEALRVGKSLNRDKKASRNCLGNGELFSYNDTSALCKIARVGKRMLGIKVGNTQKIVPVNFHGNERVSDDIKKQEILLKEVKKNLWAARSKAADKMWDYATDDPKTWPPLVLE